MYKLRLTNKIDWAHEFNASCGEHIKTGCTNAFKRYNADHAEAFFKFSTWVKQQQREIEAWYQDKLKTCRMDARASLDGQYSAWMCKAARGQRYGRNIMTPVTDPKTIYLELHVQCPVRFDWLNPTPWISNRQYGDPTPPGLTPDLTIYTWKKHQSFDELYRLCAAMAEHSRNLSAFCDWVADAAIKPQKPNLTVVDNNDL